MSKKNKQSNKTSGPKESAGLTTDQKIEIDQAHEKVTVFPEVQSSAEPIPTVDISTYWIKLKNIGFDLEKKEKATEEWKLKFKSERDDFEKTKSDLDKIREIHKLKNQTLDGREKELTEREFALENGEFTGVAKRLFASMKTSQEDILFQTTEQIQKLTKIHTEIIEEFGHHHQSELEFQRKVIAFERDKKKQEIDNQVFKEVFLEEEKAKFKQQVDILSKENETLKQKFAVLEADYNYHKDYVVKIRAAFKSTDPVEMINEITFLKKELVEKTEEVKNRHDKREYESLKDKLQLALSENDVLKGQIDQTALLELRERLQMKDENLSKIKNLEEQVKTAYASIDGLNTANITLKDTIEKLKGDSKNKESAFEFSRKCDKDSGDLQINFLESKRFPPKDLKELVLYTQNRMSYSSTGKSYDYRQETIRTFLAGLHMSQLSILQGISGTGKTSLPREFIKCLVSDPNYQNDEKDARSPYKICPVQSGWRDNTDLLGYYNSFENKYNETDFFKALYLANQPKYKDTLFFIILDEMNLSRPEHYFADFLSLLEWPENERFMSVAKTPEEALPKLLAGGKLKVPDNVRFIGTANHDETTLEFAPKTYDRSNVMEMPKNRADKPQALPQYEKLNFNISYSWLKGEFHNATERHSVAASKFLKFINGDEFKLLLDEKGIGVGNRLDDQSRRFISVYLESGTSSEKDLSEAADHLITSRLFKSLKNRYELDANAMKKFRDEYTALFSKSFAGNMPFQSIELLNKEISGKP